MFEFTDLIDNAAAIDVFSDGRVVEYKKGEAEFSAVLGAWHRMTEGAHPMPAFGVCIDALTRQEKQAGVWLEFKFPQTQTSGGMPFDKLLLKVCPEYRGINLCRYSGGAYGGRCFYLDLGEGDMSGLYQALSEIENKENGHA